MLLPYLWPKGRRDLKARVALSLFCLVLAKVATVYVPFLFKEIVDSLSGSPVAIAIMAPLSVDRRLHHRAHRHAGVGAAA